MDVREIDHQYRDDTDQEMFYNRRSRCIFFVFPSLDHIEPEKYTKSTAEYTLLLFQTRADTTTHIMNALEEVKKTMARGQFPGDKATVMQSEVLSVKVEK